MDDEVVEGEAIELESSQNSTAARETESIIRIADSKPTADGRPADRDLHPLVKARAVEFARRHEAMARAYEQQLFETMTASLEAIRQPPPVRPAKPPLVARLASSLGEGLIQAGRHLVKAVDPEDPGQGAPEPPRVVDASTIIVLTEEGDIDD